ncbi:MAG: transporter substrate-binding domain-containing protein [Desulfobacterales bacterium]|nr:MAG: transporter substrate-binding domain-containing protein [Desulfobacterales bacterium]
MKKAVFVAALVGALALIFVTTAPAGTVFDRILKKGELVVGITGTQPPLNATTKEGQIIGLDADIAKLIAKNMGVKVRFATLKFAALLPALQAGKVDMILSGMTMTPERNLKVAFIGPYYISGKGILTKAKNIAALQAADGLNDPQFKVAVLKASTSQEFVEKTAPQAKLVLTQSYDEALDLLFQDKVDALIADYPFCAFSAFRHADKELTAGQSRLTFEPLGIAVQEDPLLMNWLQNFMKMLDGSGQLGKLNERWFKDASWVKELP